MKGAFQVGGSQAVRCSGGLILDHLLYEDSEVGSARLIRAPVASSPEIPVLRIHGAEVAGDFGPADILADPWSGKPSTERAADVVHAWAADPDRTEEQRAAARLFLRQWSDGPQMDG
jgi:hypothetical protein